LRAYGGRDPLVEYKNEGHKAFGQLLATIDANIAENILKAGIQVNKQAPQSHTIESGKKEIGRNDTCPCGSGKKWKKCGMLNTEEHQKLMAK
jgi:preprotein translocase subunit SecA